MRMHFCIAIPLASAFALPQMVDAAPAVWVTHGGERISQTAAERKISSVELFAARGEWEPFQIVVHGPANGVDVTVSDLRTATGDVISKNNITLYKQHYIYDPKGNPVGSGPGWYPDGLIPFVHPETGQSLSGARFDAVPFSVSAGKVQPIWADLFVPRTAKPGRYTGTVTVVSSAGSASATVVLNVWNFELPSRLTMKAEGNLETNPSKAAQIEILKHNVAPRKLSELGWQDEFVEKYGMKTVGIGFWTGVDMWNCKSAPLPAPPSKAQVQAEVAKYRADLVKYAYFADEVYECLSRSGFGEWVKNYAKALQDGGAVPLLTIPPVDGVWIPGPYIWVGSIGAYNSEFLPAFGEARSAGQDAWSYHMFSGSSQSPKWFLDSDPIELRVHTGFLSQSLDITGFLFWRMDFWKGGAAGSWTEVQDRGDGHFVYAGSEAGVPGVIASIRLKRARDGFEDYEYIALLKKVGQGAWALERSRSVAADKGNYTHDWNKLLTVRRELGEKLHQIGGGEPISSPGTCNLYQSGQTPPSGFGASYNVFSTSKELLLDVTCGETSNTLNVGNGHDTTYIYRIGYEWVNGQWKAISFGGQKLVANDWYIGNAAANLLRSQTQLAQDNFVVAYTCLWIDRAWRCGCRNPSCATNHWQLQVFRK